MMDQAEFNRRIQAMMPQSARTNYFQKGNGPMFMWTVEPFNLIDKTDKAQGQYESVVYRPIGPGSRSGKATRWERDEDSASLHTLRREAKARALRLFEQWESEQS